MYDMSDEWNEKGNYDLEILSDIEKDLQSVTSHESSLWADIGAGSTTSTVVKNRVTREEMLGHKKQFNDDLRWREDCCAFCGFLHKNPSLLDLYAYCENCGCCFREPSTLRKRYLLQPAAASLDILIASYGDCYDAGSAIDVTVEISDMVNVFERRDRLSIRRAVQLDEIFKKDPSPGRLKQLRVRYRMLHRFGSIVVPISAENRLFESFLLVCPRERLLTILSASYGHPRGKSKTGRMSHDVSR